MHNVFLACARRGVNQQLQGLAKLHTQAETVNCVVIGAGVVGLACARALSQAGKEVVLVEQHNTFGQETSSRHSEVIHAGLYYPPGSLKAQLCVRGNRLMYEYCSSRGVAHKRVTKLLVATDKEQEDALRATQERASLCGVTDLVPLSGAEAMEMEPNLRASAALLSPTTGIVDSHGLMQALLADIEQAGGVLAVASQVVRGIAEGPGQRLVQQAPRGAGNTASCSSSGDKSGSTGMGGRSEAVSSSGDGILLEVKDLQSDTTSWLRAKQVVNCGGLRAQHISSLIQGIPSASIPKQFLAKGVYFNLSKPESAPDAWPGRAPFSRLIYPLPPKSGGGLGHHLTLDLSGAARFGPDVEWVDKVDYEVDPGRASSFYPAIRTFWPGLPDGALVPGYAGVRPKLSGPGQPPADFMIQGAEGVAGHGVKGLVCLYGIESPGLTSSLAIGEVVARMLE